MEPIKNILLSDTIYALSSGKGRAAISIFRLSGPNSCCILKTILKNQDLPPPRHSALRFLYDPEGDILDQALILFFPAPHSFTGEDCIEIHCHGSPAIILDLLSYLGSFKKARLAQPGEFTRRAFYHGKMDLTASEGLIDLINSETSQQRKQAIKQMNGQLFKLYDTWKTQLMHTLASMEAFLEFPEEDISPKILEKIFSDLQNIKRDILHHLNDNMRGERLREGLQITILGEPNAGKSSLMNVIAQKDIAIVSSAPGTTRDLLHIDLHLNGYPLRLFDTAGLRKTSNVIEKEGIFRAKTSAQNSDIRLIVIDSTTYPLFSVDIQEQIQDTDLIILNKIDIKDPSPFLPFSYNNGSCQKTLPVCLLSTKTQQGIPHLLQRLTQCVETLTSGEGLALTRARHREALSVCVSHLERAQQSSYPELLSEDLRLSVRAISQITGKIHCEDILDIVFQEFCIGK